MSEPIDAMMPILQRIQADLAETKRDLGAKIDKLAEQVSAATVTLEAIQRYFIYQLGMTSRNEADIEHIHEEIKAMVAQISVLEARP